METALPPLVLSPEVLFSIEETAGSSSCFLDRRYGPNTSVWIHGCGRRPPDQRVQRMGILWQSIRNPWKRLLPFLHGNAKHWIPEVSSTWQWLHSPLLVLCSLALGLTIALLMGCVVMVITTSCCNIAVASNCLQHRNQLLEYTSNHWFRTLISKSEYSAQ